MALRIGSAQQGDTPLMIAHRLLTEDCGYNTPRDKAVVANQLLGTNVDKIEDLSDAELASLVEHLVKQLYG